MYSRRGTWCANLLPKVQNDKCLWNSIAFRSDPYILDFPNFQPIFLFAWWGWGWWGRRFSSNDVNKSARVLPRVRNVSGWRSIFGNSGFRSLKGQLEKFNSNGKNTNKNMINVIRTHPLSFTYWYHSHRRVETVHMEMQRTIIAGNDSPSTLFQLRRCDQTRCVILSSPSSAWSSL